MHVRFAFQVQRNRFPKYRMWEAGSLPVLCKRPGGSLLATRSIEVRVRSSCWAEKSPTQSKQGQRLQSLGQWGPGAGWPGFSPVLVLHFPRCLCGCGCQASQSKPRFVACGPCYGGSLGSLPGISLKEQTLNKRRRMADGSEAVQLMGVIVVGHRQGLKQGSPQRADQGPKQRRLV